MKGFFELLFALCFFGGCFWLIWFFGAVADGKYRKQIHDFFTEIDRLQKERGEEIIRKRQKEFKAGSKT